jgi:Zn-finger nucleic acid-binding protein
MNELRCARCGAPLPPSSARAAATCTYCGATSAPPPRVVERVVERVVVATAQEPDGATMRCPRCADGLREARSGDAVVRACRACGGVWLEAATVERLMRARDPELETAARRLVGVVLMPVPNRHARISCPACGATMRRVEVPETVHSIDVCDPHGTWFDRDELPIFVSAFAEARAGEVTDDDLDAAGVGGGFFTSLFRKLR